MKIACSVYVNNRLLPTLSINKPKKYMKSTLALCKHPKSNDYCIILFTNQDKNGTKYPVNGNIKQVLTRFVNEGKCTIQFLKPEHDMLINSDVIQLKGFLHLFRRVLENKVSDKELSVSSMAVTPIKPKDIAPTKLIITSRSALPSKGFPRTLEVLSISDIRRCGVDRSILNLLKLRTLDLSNNLIESLPTELERLPNLKELRLAHNRLGKGCRDWRWIDGCLANNLTLLDVSHNELEMVPNQICKMYQLVTLNLSDNNLKSLPTAIGNLGNLRLFMISNNQLTVLPGSITRLRLSSIDTAGNEFEQVRVVYHEPHPLPVCTLKEYAARRVILIILNFFILDSM